MYRNILVPLDGSDFAELALPTAAALANAMGAELTLVHVCDMTAPDYHAGEAARAAQRTIFLGKAAADVEHKFQVKPSTVLLEGVATDALSEHAQRCEAPLIVMSTHGRTGWSRAWLGSVADGVMRRATAPVLMLSDGDVTHDPTAGWPLPFRTIVVPLDGTSFAEQVLAHAATVAEASHAQLILLHVVTPVAPTAPEIPISYVPPAQLIDELTSSLVARARDRGSRLAARLRAVHPRLDVRDEVVIGNSVAHAIIDASKRRHADCVAMATHGRGLSRLVVASVADKVVRGGPGAVLLVHPHHD